MIRKFFYVGSFLLGSVLFSTTVQAQSFLEKTLKVVDAVDKLSRSSKSAAEKKNEVSVQATVEMGGVPQGFHITAPFKDLAFKVRSCTMEGSTVVLELTVKNLEKNQHFMFGGDDRHVRTIMVDEQDNSYDYEKIKISIGDKSPEVTQSELFPTHVPVKIHIYINEVEPTARLITMLSLRVEGFDTPVTFYNIPIEHPVATTAVSTNLTSTGNTMTTSSSLTTQQEPTHAASKLERLIGKWELISLKKDGKEQSFSPFSLQFLDTPKDNPYNKDLIETIVGKSEMSGYTIIHGTDNQLVMSFPSITDDEEDNGYTIQSVDAETLVLTFCYYGIRGTDGIMTFKREQ